jgi:hypothetical protein
MNGEPVEEDVRDCIRSVKNEFTTYDQTVDIVSCLEVVLEEVYHDAIDLFDRFPRFRDPDLTPDGSVLFKNGYGLVVEVKRTLPDNDAGFLRSVQQLKRYDTELDMRTRDGGTRVPEVMDIALLIKADNANEIFTRFQRVCEEEGIAFDRNLVLMEFYYDSSDTVSKYVIRKWIGSNRPFRDELGEDGLEEVLGRRAKSLSVLPEQFISRKLASVFVNDDPPPIYTVVLLWTKVLHNLLEPEQREEWRVAGPTKRLFIECDVDEIVTFINDGLLEKGRVRRGWIVRALEFLQTCGLAEFPSRDRVRITYRNLRQMISPRTYETDGQKTVDEHREYCGLFASIYCKRSMEGDGSGERVESTEEGARQETLFGFGGQERAQPHHNDGIE